MSKKSAIPEKATKFSKKTLVKALDVFKYMKPYLFYFIIAMIMLVAGSLLFMLIIRIIGEMVNVATGESTLEYDLQELGMFLFVVVVIQALFSMFRTIAFSIVSEKSIADIRKDLYNKLISQPLAYFENERTGDLISRITADVEQLQGTLSHSLAEFIRQLVILVAGIAILAYLTPQLSLIMLFTFPVVVIAAVLFGKYIRKLSKIRQEKLADSAIIVNETFQNFNVVKSFASELFESLRYGKSVDGIVQVSLRFARIRGVFFAFVIGLLFGCILFILYKGAIMVQEGNMEPGNLLSFVMYTAVLGGAIAGLGNLYATILGTLGATERIFEILERDTELELKNISNSNTIKIDGKIAFDSVSFAYPSRSEVQILDNFSFDINRGEKIAFVGQSGSGKTTIAKLIMRFYNVQSGNILVDDKPIDEYNISELRKNIGVVPQEVLLFGGSIRENILYGDPNASEEAVWDAAKQANAVEFINKLPDGLDTIIGERGIKLSGGQKQRVAIARALLKNPAILILDEATSSLDAESERLVQDALDVLMEGRTSIIIAHRLATIKDVDNIYVIEDGKIIEKGTHQELTDIKNGVYNQLARLQFELY